jgi:hypothetical protein
MRDFSINDLRAIAPEGCTVIKLADDTLTADDWTWLRECYASSIAECEAEGWEFEGEDVMTSIGYVGLASDGDVVAFGRNLGNVND